MNIKPQPNITNDLIWSFKKVDGYEDSEDERERVELAQRREREAVRDAQAGVMFADPPPPIPPFSSYPSSTDEPGTSAGPSSST